MPFSLEIQAFGETVTKRDLLRFEENLLAPQVALEIAAKSLREASQHQFDSQGGNSGGWAPLAASTLIEKRRRGYPSEILQATGALMRSLTQKFDPQHIERLYGDSLAFGSTVSYGAFHQTGTRRMPRRPPLALSAADKVKLVKEIQVALLAGVQAAGVPLGLAA